MRKFKIEIDFEIEAPVDYVGIYDEILNHIYQRLREITHRDGDVKTSVKVSKEIVEG